MTQILFHGTRGSFPTSSTEHVKYGGHTSCVSLLYEDQWIIIDAGTGLINADDFVRNQNIKKCHLFLSHLHLDHISGLPAFPLSWDPDFEINLYCGISKSYGGIQSILANIFKPPYFPIKLSEFKAEFKYRDFDAGDSFNLNSEILVQTIRLDHPDGACGYKFILGDQSIVYLCDTSHERGMKDQLAKFSTNCDLLIYDSTYCNSEFEAVAHYGHSTWQVACEIAQKASVKQLALFHHEPNHTDRIINNIERQARLLFPNTFAAACGGFIKL